MRDPQRIGRICTKIMMIWDKGQDQRFGQMLINYGIIEDGPEWNREDDEIENHLDSIIKKMKGGKK